MDKHGGTLSMSKDKIHIIDTIFSHAKSSSWYNEPDNFEWVRTFNLELMVMTDNNLFGVDKIKSKKKVAWLVESPSVTPTSYRFVLDNYNKFDKIYTFDKNILETTENSEFVPIGGCWVDVSERYIHNKSKNVSIIASNKNIYVGHKLRHDVISNISSIDVYGTGYKRIENKIDGLKDYKFSISIENIKSDYYFTEKLIDCFITGTIPIYWGCPSIGDFFDIDGILVFNDIDELKNILSNLDGLYEKKLPSIKKNYELCKKYLVADNLIYEKINYLKNINK